MGVYVSTSFLFTAENFYKVSFMHIKCSRVGGLIHFLPILWRPVLLSSSPLLLPSLQRVFSPLLRATILLLWPHTPALTLASTEVWSTWHPLLQGQETWFLSFISFQSFHCAVVYLPNVTAPGFFNKLCKIGLKMEASNDIQRYTNQPEEKVVETKKIKNDSQGIFTKLGQTLCLILMPDGLIISHRAWYHLGPEDMLHFSPATSRLCFALTSFLLGLA